MYICIVPSVSHSFFHQIEGNKKVLLKSIYTWYSTFETKNQERMNEKESGSLDNPTLGLGRRGGVATIACVFSAGVASVASQGRE